MISSATTSVSWLGAYLFCEEPWENFLVRAVLPFVEQTMATELAEQFFFVRYWEFGPHIRLRFKGRKETLQEELKPAIQSFFTTYFRENPTQRRGRERSGQYPGNSKEYPNDSIQFIKYEPEYERYGGLIGVNIAECQFEASSKVVLSLLKSTEGWDYSQALGVAIHMHLALVHAMKLDLNETVLFFDLYFRNWSHYAYRTLSYRQHGNSEPSESSTELSQAFAKSYSLHKAILLPNLRAIWEGLQNNQEFEEDWFTYWLTNMQNVGKQLHTAQEYIAPPSYISKRSFSAIPDQYRLKFALLDSYVHMTNNRLGILNRDEGYLSYLMKQGLVELQ